MKKQLWIIFMFIFCMIGAFFFGMYIGFDPAPPEIIKETKTEYKYIKTPQTCDEYKTAFNEPIEIYGEIDKSWLDVTATDGYKQSKKGFKISQSKNWNYVIYAGCAGVIVGGLTIALTR